MKYLFLLLFLTSPLLSMDRSAQNFSQQDEVRQHLQRLNTRVAELAAQITSLQSDIAQLTEKSSLLAVCQTPSFEEFIYDMTNDIGTITNEFHDTIEKPKELYLKVVALEKKEKILLDNYLDLADPQQKKARYQSQYICILGDKLSDLYNAAHSNPLENSASETVLKFARKWVLSFRQNLAYKESK